MPILDQDKFYKNTSIQTIWPGGLFCGTATPLARSRGRRNGRSGQGGRESESYEEGPIVLDDWQDINISTKVASKNMLSCLTSVFEGNRDECERGRWRCCCQVVGLKKAEVGCSQKKLYPVLELFLNIRGVNSWGGMFTKTLSCF